MGMNVVEDARAANTFLEGSVHVSHMYNKMHKIVYSDTTSMAVGVYVMQVKI